MERELWSALYQLARKCDPAPWWDNVRFFRLQGRECVPLGGAARTARDMGLRCEQLA